MIAEILFGRSERAAINQQLGHPQAGNPFWMGGNNTLAGVSVDDNTAMNYSACWAATRLLCGTEAWLPFNLYREKKGGGKEIAWNHPVHRLIYAKPNPKQTAMMFRAAQMQQQVNAGNCYAEIERTNGGQIVALHPVHYTRVKPKDGDDGLVYEISNRNGRKTTLDAAEVFHVPSLMSDDGIVGKGVVQAARESIGFGLGTEAHGAAYFGNGARPSVLLKHPAKLGDIARGNLRKEWKETHGGPENAGGVAVLQEGMEAQILSISPEDSQFLQTRQHNVEEIARWYGVPPHMIQHLLRSTFNNIEHQSIEFVTHSLIPWLRLWETEVYCKLLTEKEQETYYAKHVIDALLRGDAKTRTEALVQQFRHGNLDLDTWAEIEDRNPIGGEMGKARFVEQNMQTLERAVAGEPEPVQTINTSALPEPDDDTEARAAVMGVFTEVVARMTAMEVEAAERAAKHPASFMDKIEAFYRDHGDRMQKALHRPLACVKAVCGECRPLGELVAEHCEESRQALLEASECPATELAASVAKCVAGWETRIIEPLLSEVAV